MVLYILMYTYSRRIQQRGKASAGQDDPAI
jgi:hypothetical protein